MSRQRVTEQQAGFGGGLNTVADDSQLAENQIRTAINLRLTEHRACLKRLGTQRTHVTALSGLIQGGTGWQKATGTEELVVAAGQLWRGTYAIPMTWTQVPGSVSATTRPVLAAFRDAAQDALYLADGGPLNKYTPATFVSDLGGTPNVASVAVYNSRLFGVSGVDESLYWSGLNNGDTLGVVAQGGGQAIVRTFADQRLVAVAGFRSSLLLFHVSGISRFTGLSLEEIEIKSGTVGVTGDVGTLAPRSIVPLENGVLFLSDRGIYVADEVSVQPVSATIDVEFSSLTAAQLAQVTAVHNRVKREVWFYIPNRGVYVLAYRTGGWAGPWTGAFLAPTAMWETVDENGTPIVLVGDANGFVKRADKSGVNQDDVLSDSTGGAPYTLTLKFRRFFHDQDAGMAAEKAYRWAYLLADLAGSTGAKLAWFTQTGQGEYALMGGAQAWGEVGSLWGTGVWGGSGVVLFRIPIHGRGGFIDVSYIDAGVKASLVSKVEVEGFHMGRRGG